MGGLSGMLGTARDGIMAQSAALDTTGQNVANVNTPGYAKRTAVLASRAQPGSAGGVDVVTFARDAAGLASRRVYGEAGKSGAADARAMALATIESMVSPQSGGISDRTSAFFSSLTALSADGNSTAARATVLARATDLAASFADAAASLNSERATQLDSARSVVTDVNASLASIAKFNGQIAAAEATGTPANDMRDARDVLVRGVADATGAHVVEDERGQMTMFVAGTALVSGNTSRLLSIDLDAQGNMHVLVVNPGGAPSDVTSHVTQGKLGGLREARDVDTPKVMAGLDQLAFDIATQANSVHSAGVGQDGIGGRNLFAAPAGVAGAAYSMKIDPAVGSDPRKLAAAGTAGDLPGGGSVALALSKLATTQLGAAAGTPGERIASWLGSVGTMASSANDEATLRAGTVATAESNFESQRGVSLDEEMVNLTRFQRAFEASTRILRAADELLGNLIKEL